MENSKILQLAQSVGHTHNVDVDLLVRFAQMVLQEYNRQGQIEHSKYYYDYDRNR